MRALAAQAVGDVLRHGQIGKQGIGLKQDAVVAFLRLGMGDVAAGQRDDAAVLAFQPGDGAQQRGLAAARGPSRQTSSPARISSDTSANAVWAPKRLTRLRTVRKPPRAGLAAARRGRRFRGRCRRNRVAVVLGHDASGREQRQYGAAYCAFMTLRTKVVIKHQIILVYWRSCEIRAPLACTVLVAELKSFYAVARCGTVTKAAAQLGVSQPR